MKWFLGIIGVIVLLILMVVLIFRRPNKPATTTVSQPVSSVASLASIANTSAEVRYTIDGKIVSTEEHRSVRITIARDSRRLEILEGYEDVVISSTDLNNTEAAYEAFLAALEQAGYNKTQESSIASEDGLCPLGRRYTFEIIEFAAEKQRTWTTSCGSKVGTFSGNRSVVEQLFKAQIPDYNKIVSGLRL